MSTLDTLRQRGHQFRLGPDGKLLHRGPVMDADELRRLAPIVKAELAAKQPVTPPIGADVLEHPPASAQPDAASGLPCPRRESRTGETRELIAWFEAARQNLPARPFDLYPHLRVVEPARFYSFIAEWIADGEKSPHPGLTDNLRLLREVVTRAQDGS